MLKQRKRVIKRVEDNPDSDIMEDIKDEQEKIRKEEAKAKERAEAVIGVLTFDRQGHVDVFDGEAAPPSARMANLLRSSSEGSSCREVPAGSTSDSSSQDAPSEGRLTQACVGNRDR